MPEGNYTLYSKEYHIESPNEFVIKKSEIKELNIRIRKIEEESVTIRGKILNQVELPIHHAYVRIKTTDLTGDVMGESTVSIPDGSFQMEVPLSLFERSPEIEVEHAL